MSLPKFKSNLPEMMNNNQWTKEDSDYIKLHAKFRRVIRKSLVGERIHVHDVKLCLDLFVIESQHQDAEHSTPDIPLQKQHVESVIMQHLGDNKKVLLPNACLAQLQTWQSSFNTSREKRKKVLMEGTTAEQHPENYPRLPAACRSTRNNHFLLNANSNANGNGQRSSDGGVHGPESHVYRHNPQSNNQYSNRYPNPNRYPNVPYVDYYGRVGDQHQHQGVYFDINTPYVYYDEREDTRKYQEGSNYQGGDSTDEHSTDEHEHVYEIDRSDDGSSDASGELGSVSETSESASMEPDMETEAAEEELPEEPIVLRLTTTQFKELFGSTEPK